MIFFSYQFIVFTALFFAIYWIIPKPKARLLLLLFSCAAFHYHFAGPAGVLPIIVLGVGTYFIGLTRNRLGCLVWICICVSALSFYKYTPFIISNVLKVAPGQLLENVVQEAHSLAPTIPPLGLSFFTFEFVHYLVEIYRGRRPIRSAINFSLFAIFWPSLVAGPIKRYRQFIPSMMRGLHNVRAEDALAGAVRVSTGIVKKIAGDMLAGWIEANQSSYDQFPLVWRWVFVAAIGAKILFDFSGYTDMAIGFARMMGIKLPENFNWPYLAHNVSDFWKRWHISLSTWIRDYIYIPLGGSKLGPVSRILNALIAMILCGLWHGAAWNFAIWGVYHGLGLIIVGALPRLREVLPSRLVHFSTNCAENHRWVANMHLLASWAITMLFVHVGWVVFFYPIDTALHMITLLFSP